MRYQKSSLRLHSIAVALLLGATGSVAQAQESVSERERLLLERIERLERRLAELETRISPTKTDPAPAREVAQPTSEVSQIASAPTTVTPKTETSDFFRDTTFNVTIDGYYSYNFNRPVGGINLLRAYDVSSNSFSLNQAAIVIENAPNLEKGKRYGLRLDLQYGQATETVQDNAANELRPQVYRNLWQAYGTYVFDVGKELTNGQGLTVDFGKFASNLGYETNYTKDKPSGRLHIFDTYHTFNVNDKLTLAVEGDYVVGRVFRDSAGEGFWWCGLRALPVDAEVRTGSTA